MSHEVSVDYDRDNDILFLFKKGVRSKGSVEVGPNISIDFGENDIPVGIEIIGASEILSKVFGIPVSKDALCNIKRAALRSEKKDNFIYIYYGIIWAISKDNLQEREANDMLPIPQVVTH